MSQFPPDLGQVGKPVDDVLGQTVPPVLNTTYDTLGQNITREDVRIHLSINVTSADVGLMGLLIGSGPIKIDATIDIRLELRVISSERIKNAVIGDDPLNVTGENSTFLTYVYLPAEVFRATLSAEAVAAFQAEQEAALRDMVARTVPELQIIELGMNWENTFPTQALTDLSLTEPPIVVEVSGKIQYARVESIPNLLNQYLGTSSNPSTERAKFLTELKEENSDPLRTRDFFAAAAYTQLLNLSMQPGWSMDVDLRVPRGFSFEYFNENVEVSDDRRHASFSVDAATSDGAVEQVVVASLTQRRAVALAIFVGMWFVAGLIAMPIRSIYAKQRVPRLLLPPDAEAAGGAGKHQTQSSSKRPWWKRR